MTQPHTDRHAGRPGATQDQSDEGFCGGACGAGAGAAVIWRPLGQGGGSGQSR
ncbi:hypothetical protein [Azospirillum thermophilum]|nr:hypothetical protein [Azospirillum thermophilum]